MKSAAERIRPLIVRLRKQYPDAECSLHYKNPLQLLAATILSAQCTDVRVNIVTRELFKRYRSARGFANANPDELSEIIRTTGFFRNKTKSLIGMGKTLVEDYGGKVPDSMEKLVKIPGVGRKTANVVLGNAFGKNEGVVVDTHVGRISRRLGLTKHTDAVKVEADLAKIVPRKDWTLFPHLMIQHGREICTARKIKCEICPINSLCPTA